MSARGYRAIDHTADLAFELWAPSEPELLVEGARAIVATLTEDASLKKGEERRIELDALDGEDRLVRWLNEVVYLAVTEGFITAEAEIELEGAGHLEARVMGETAPEKIHTEVKSVTYHDLALAEGDDGWRARVVIDV